MKALVRLDQVVIQHTHNEWSSITNPGLLTIASQQEDVQAEMLSYTMATNPYYFPVVIVPVFVLCLRLSTDVDKSALASDPPIQISH